MESIEKNQDKVILFIHGITGHPNQFRDFYPMVPDSYAKHMMLLKGHGGSVDDFGKATMQDWQNQVDFTLAELRQNYSEIYVVAHSMGTLFTLQRIQNPGIKAVLLLAVPLKIRFKLKPFFINVKKMIDYQKNPSGSFDPRYGIEPDLRFWKYFKWIPNYLALLKEIGRTKKLLGEGFPLNKEIKIFQSAKDELVSPKTTAILQNSGLQVDVLKDSFHYEYSDLDLQKILTGFSELLSEV
ncbi:MAG: alpha/beta fold hydrolase [Clostridiaceae bacterium]|nr:alpha/beta fold hydrolase [Clostridiaceae bacterium]